MADKSTTATAGGLRGAFRKDPYITRLVIMLIVIFVFFAITKSEQFLKPTTFQSIMRSRFPEFGIMALGVMLCMITAGIDLSVVSIANLSGVVCALYLVGATTNLPEGAGVGGQIFLTFVLGFAVGIGCGLLNGFLVSKVKIPPILTTLP